MVSRVTIRMAILKPIRLKKRKQYVLMSEKGLKYVASGFVLQVLPNHTDEIRVGFTVTKRIGCAVVRNRVRRRLREVVRLSSAIHRMKGYDFVIIGRKSTIDRPFHKLLHDLSSILHEVQHEISSKIKNEGENLGFNSDTLGENI